MKKIVIYNIDKELQELIIYIRKRMNEIIIFLIKYIDTDEDLKSFFSNSKNKKWIQSKSLFEGINLMKFENKKYL